LVNIVSFGSQFSLRSIDLYISIVSSHHTRKIASNSSSTFPKIQFLVSEKPVSTTTKQPNQQAYSSLLVYILHFTSNNIKRAHFKDVAIFLVLVAILAQIL